RMKRRQQWSLLPYVLDLVTVGVASARDKPPFKFVKYSFPQKLRILAATKHKREVAQRVLKQIAKNTHMSTRKIRVELLPFLKVIDESNPEMMGKILKSLDISKKSFEAVLG
ncbi:MAG TPA: replication factor C large subunit, partial [Thermofilum sp.]|nr:replication factor C large subunit [Thermofilum sp.]